MAGKKKVAKALSTELIVLLDRSGSMASIRDDMVKGFDGFIAEQRKLAGVCRATLTQFDTVSTDLVYEAKTLSDVPSMELVPRGGTPLLDAMGQAITRATDRLAAATGNGRPDRVLFLVLTDGEENSSHSFTKEQIKTLVKERTTDGWEFSFLGANVDAFAEAGSLGIAAAATANFVPDSVGVKHAFAAASASLTSYRSGGVYAMVNSDPRVMQHQQTAAQTLGSKGGKKGGIARAAALTPDARSTIARQGAAARWKRSGPP